MAPWGATRRDVNRLVAGLLAVCGWVTMRVSSGLTSLPLGAASLEKV